MNTKLESIKKFAKKNKDVVTIVVSATLSSTITAILIYRLMGRTTMNLSLYRSEIDHLLKAYGESVLIKTPRGSMLIRIKDF